MALLAVQVCIMREQREGIDIFHRLIYNCIVLMLLLNIELTTSYRTVLSFFEKTEFEGQEVKLARAIQF